MSSPADDRYKVDLTPIYRKRGLCDKQPGFKSLYCQDNKNWIKLSRQNRTYVEQFEKLSEQQKQIVSTLYQEVKHTFDRYYVAENNFAWDLTPVSIGKGRVVLN